MAKKKKTLAFVKLQLEAGKATPAPPVGTALGPHGVAIMDFCKAYNEQTSNRQGEVVPVHLTIYEDRSFDFVLRSSPTTALLKKAAGIEKGSGEPNRNKVATVSMQKVREIAESKMGDLSANDVDQAAKIVAGTARSMGITVEA